jgi:hypothetical protein
MKLTDEQAKHAWKVALNISRKNGQSTLGPEDFAAQAIEKLLKLEKYLLSLLQRILLQKNYMNVKVNQMV